MQGMWAILGIWVCDSQKCLAPEESEELKSLSFQWFQIGYLCGAESNKSGRKQLQDKVTSPAANPNVSKETS